MKLEDFDRIWMPIYGNPSWSVRKGHGSFLTLEFGSPQLQIREPRIASPGASKKVRELSSRRLVHVTGNWHLWIYCCNWSIALSGEQLAHNESPDHAITSAAKQIDGQELVKVEQGAASAEWVFRFDLDGRLTTWPYETRSSAEQWFLYERASGNVLSTRADGLVAYGPASRASQEQKWSRIE